MNLGVELRVYRKSKGHSVQKVSELTGIPADRIYKWEKGTRPSDAEDLLKIRAYMGDVLESKPKDIGKQPDPPPYIQVSWQDYMKLIHFSLEQLMAGQNEILKQQAKTRAEVRGYGKYHLVKDAKGSREKFDKLLAEVDRLVNDDLREDDGQDIAAGK